MSLGPCFVSNTGNLPDVIEQWEIRDYCLFTSAYNKQKYEKDARDQGMTIEKYNVFNIWSQIKYEETMNFSFITWAACWSTRVVSHSLENLTEYLTTVGHLKQIVLSKFLEHASFNFHKLLERRDVHCYKKQTALMPR